MSPWHVVEHTADVGLEATGESIEEAIEALLEGFGRLVCPEAEVEASEKIHLEVEAPSLDDAVVDLLDELNYVHQVDRFLPARGEVELAGSQEGCLLRVDVCGENYDPDVHGHLMEIKATTYHGLEVEEQPGRVHVIFDV